jgi:hypothetical protein
MNVPSSLAVCMSVFLTITTATANARLTATCKFDRALKLNQQEGTAFPPNKIDQSMRIESNATSAATLALDGSRRATNSRIWSALERRDFETFESRFIGDFGDVLTLQHELGANQRALRGVFRASLVTPGVASTVVQVGQCVLE